MTSKPWMMLSLVLFVVPAWAEDKGAPVAVTAVVKGLDADAQKAIEKALKANEAVEMVMFDKGAVMVHVKAEKTFKLSDLAKAVEGASTKEKPLEVQRGDISLVGTVEVDVSGTGDAKDDAVIAALKSAPNVDKAEGKDGKFNVTFKGSKGATIKEVEDALKAKIGAKEGSAGPKCDDICWTAPKAEKAKGHGCGAGGCGKGG